MECEIDAVTQLADGWNDRQRMLNDITEAVLRFRPDQYGRSPFASLWELESAKERSRLIAAAVRVVNARAGMLLIDPELFLKIDEDETTECDDAIHKLTANIIIETEAETEEAKPPALNRSGEIVFSARQVQEVIDAVQEIGCQKYPTQKQILGKISIDKNLIGPISLIARQVTHPESGE